MGDYWVIMDGVMEATGSDFGYSKSTTFPSGFVGSCKYHSQCNAGKKCKGFWNMDKMCRKRKTDCKVRGTKYQKNWGRSAGKKCDPNPNTKWSKWGTCVSM